MWPRWVALRDAGVVKLEAVDRMLAGDLPHDTGRAQRTAASGMVRTAGQGLARVDTLRPPGFSDRLMVAHYGMCRPAPMVIVPRRIDAQFGVPQAARRAYLRRYHVRLVR